LLPAPAPYLVDAGLGKPRMQPEDKAGSRSTAGRLGRAAAPEAPPAHAYGRRAIGECSVVAAGGGAPGPAGAQALRGRRLDLIT
jgi:hypothetical protein